MRSRYFTSVLGLAAAVLCSAGIVAPAAGTRSPAPDLKSKVLHNPIAYIPPQCFIKTELPGDVVVNPCYVCHTRSVAPNHINDWDLQLNYSFPERNLKNPWTNLFEDRTARVAAISDADIVDYVRTDNYFDTKRDITPAKTLRSLPPEWDNDNDGLWSGYVPDCFFNFNEQGYDLAPDGSLTGWRVYTAYPLPTTHWPTSGAPSATLIRLPEAFRQTAAGDFDPAVYSANLAIVEALISRRDVVIAPTDERLVGVDLNKDGTLGLAERVVYDWAPLEGRRMSYAGRAGQEQKEGKQQLAAGLFPVGTELLQAVSYLDVVDGTVTMAPRLRELRYMKKTSWQSYADLEEAALAEIKEKDDFPARTSQYVGNFEQGLYNGWGWILQGFIEDSAGTLRPQSYEETMSCVGCHGGLGASTDSVFSFARKLDHRRFKGGWFHPQEKSLAGLVEPKVEIRNAGVFYEYSYYLMYNRAASDLRDQSDDQSSDQNGGQARFFKPDGSVKLQALNQLHDDISLVLTPTPERALALNKAYKTIVEDQDFILGRDAQIQPLNEVMHEKVEADQPTGVSQATNTLRFGGSYLAGSLAGSHSGSLPCEPSHTRSQAKQQAAEPQPARSEADQAAQEFVVGEGSDGPDGERYEVNWQGEIAQSRYANPSLKGVFYTFPDRITLPTRVIGPITNDPSCYVCHRIPYPNVAKDNAYSEGPPETIAAPERPWQNVSALSTGKGARLGGQWSPDGSRIAYVSDESGSNQIWLMDKDGGNTRQLTKGSAIHAWPQWHPQGRELVVWGYDEAEKTHAIKTINSQSGEAKTMVSSREHLDRPAWSPDGNWLAYAALTGSNWDIWLMRADGSDKRQLTHDPQMETNPLWRPDGTAIAYKVAPAGEYNLTAQYFMRFKGPDYSKPVIHPWNGPEAVQMNAWSPDGSSIAYTAEVVSNSSGKDRVSYVAMVSDISFPEADGPVQTKNTIQLSQGCTLGDRGPVFSPDGTSIAYWAWDKDYKASLRLYDRAAQKTWSITESGWAMYPQWSPDGGSLLFEQYQGGDTNLRLLRLGE